MNRERKDQVGMFSVGKMREYNVECQQNLALSFWCSMNDYKGPGGAIYCSYEDEHQHASLLTSSELQSRRHPNIAMHFYLRSLSSTLNVQPSDPCPLPSTLRSVELISSVRLRKVTASIAGAF